MLVEIDGLSKFFLQGMYVCLLGTYRMNSREGCVYLRYNSPIQKIKGDIPTNPFKNDFK